MLKRACLNPNYILLSLLIFFTYAVYAENILKPRYIPLKPVNTIFTDHHDQYRVIVKFRDNYDIGLDDRRMPYDRGGAILISKEIRNIFEMLDNQNAVWKRATGTSESNLDRLIKNAETKLQRQLPDLNNYFLLTLKDGHNSADLINRLNTIPEIEIAYPLMKPAPSPLPGDYQSMQGYINAPDDGIGASSFWNYPGGKGQNVKICDVEMGWNPNHRDLPLAELWVPAGYHWATVTDIDHGTAVLGEMVSLDNNWGTTGSSHGALAAFAPVDFEEGYIAHIAVQHAVSMLDPGDIMLIEQQMFGPNNNLVPMDWDYLIYSSIMLAVGNGIHVVEAAGNGNTNLDDPIYRQGHAPFLPENNSGAIMVGAAAAPAGFGGTDVEHSRLNFSNHGSRVDLHGWGERVMTTGYGTYYSIEGLDYWYTEDFSGTSSASPIVVSAVAIVESIIEEQTGQILSPDSMRNLLVNTGTPQRQGTYPTTQHIGPMPDLTAALESVDISDNQGILPPRILLGNNYPNPFNAKTVIRYILPEASNVTVSIYDIGGRLIETLLESEMSTGVHQIIWDAGDRQSGVYFYKITADDTHTIGKLTLTK